MLNDTKCRQNRIAGIELPRRWCIFIVSICHAFEVTKFVETEKQWSNEIFKTIMVPLHSASIFKFFYRPANFPLGENLYKKLPFL